MFRKIKQYLSFFRQIKIFDFFYYNYFSKQVIRLDKSKIIPYKGTIIDLAPDCKIYLQKGDLELGSSRLKKSKSETLFRMRGNAIWSNVGGCNISYGSTLEILNNAIFDTSFFTMNSNGVVIVAKRIVLGNDVMLGRNVILYDSDFHQIKDDGGIIKNLAKEVIIKDHVWLTSNVTILKNSYIGENSIISTGSIVSGYVRDNCIYNGVLKKEKLNYGTWVR